MKPLRILHYPVHRSSGITNYILQNWEFIDRTKFAFDFCTRFEPDQTFLKRIGPESRVFSVTQSLQKGLKPLIDTLSEAIDEGCDVLHLHTCHLFGGFPLEELAIKKGVPRIIIHAHNSGLDRTYSPADEAELLRRHEYYKAHLTTDLVTDFCACSKVAADWLFGTQIPRERIVYLNNAIDTQKFRYSPQMREKMRTELGLKEKFVLGHVGRFTEQKNHLFLLKIFRRVLNLRPNAKLVLVGDGSLYEEVQQQAEDLGDAVLFLGMREDVEALMQAFDVFVLPSLYEGLGIVLIEAQAAGLSCVVSDVVPKQANITEKFYKVSANASEFEWADTICKATDAKKRRDFSEKVSDAGYEIRNQVYLLERLYTGGSELLRDCVVGNL